ncbi:MAG: NAD(P)H-dependent oxidoreductase subunit E, partial [Candidatus Latescibacterota bacterium]
MEMAEVEEILGRYEGEPGDLIPVLQDVQERYHYLPEEVLRYISGRLHVPLSQIYHVATFYNAFSL